MIGRVHRWLGFCLWLGSISVWPIRPCFLSVRFRECLWRRQTSRTASRAKSSLVPPRSSRIGFIFSGERATQNPGYPQLPGFVVRGVGDPVTHRSNKTEPIIDNMRWPIIGERRAGTHYDRSLSLSIPDSPTTENNKSYDTLNHHPSKRHDLDERFRPSGAQ